MSDQLGDRKMVVMMDANRGHRKSDPHLDEKNLSAVDASHDLRMNVLHLDVRSLDVMDDQKMDATMDGSRGRHRNGLHLDVMMVASHGRRMNDPRLGVTDDRMMDAADANRGHRKSDQLGDRKMDATSDVSRDLRMNDLRLGETDDRMMDVMMDASRDLRMSVLHLDVKILDVNLNCHRVIRKCALHVKNYQRHRVDQSLGAKKTGGLKKNCDQLSRDHLQCDHRMLRHRGKNLNLDVKNLGVKLTSDPQYYDLTHLRHVRMNHHGNPMKVDQRMGAKDASRMRNYGHLDDPVNGTMIYLQAWLLLFFITWGK